MSDCILNLLDLMRVRGTAYIAKSLTTPWGVYIEEKPCLARFHLVTSGSTWIGMPGTNHAELLNAGDIAIIADGKAHSYTDDPTRGAYQNMNYPAEPSSARFELFDKEKNDTQLLCGYFEFSPNTPMAIRSCLPDLLIGRRNDPKMAKKFDLMVDLAREELRNDAPVSQVTLNRVTEMICVHTIQRWFQEALSENDHLRALADPKVKLVLDAIHAAPKEPWSVDSLAQIHGQSRTAFAVQFKLAMGMSPMRYVRQWRIKLACKMLEDSTLSIDEIAFNFGYSDTNAFNRAFRRELGTSPGAFKRNRYA